MKTSETTHSFWRNIKHILSRGKQFLRTVGAELGSRWPWSAAKTKAAVWITLGLATVAAVVWRLAVVTLALTIVAWGWNICYSLWKLRERFFFFLFHVVLFIFLLGRPIINALQGELVSYEQNFYTIDAALDADSTYRTLALILLSLLGLRAGAMIFDQRLWTRVPILRRFAEKLARPQNPTLQSERNSLMRLLALLLFVVSMGFSLLCELEKGAFMLEYSYVEYYASFESQLPYVIYGLSSFMPFALCVYLAMRPKKCGAYIALGLNILTNIPTLLGGQRAGFVLSVLLALCYFVYRDYLGDKGSWIGKWEKILIIFGAVGGVVLLSWVGFKRIDYNTENFGLLDFVQKFFFNQGITFSWVRTGISRLDQLRSTGVRSYALGEITDYLTHGKVVQVLFGATDLPSTNDMAKVTEGHLMGDYLSYYVLGKKSYLAGNGVGSSYLLETYVDMGSLGVLAFSVLLGLGLTGAFCFAGRGPLRAVLVLASVTGVLWLPRGNVSAAVIFLCRAPFWLSVLSVFIGARILLWLGTRWPWLQRLISRCCPKT